MRSFGVTAIALILLAFALPAPPEDAAAWGDHRYALRVFNRDGSPAPDGTVVTLMRTISREERRQIELTGVGPAACATLVVTGGFAHLEPGLSPDCPDGAWTHAIVDYKDGTYPIVSRIDPAIDWRLVAPDGPPLVVTVRPIPPNT